MSEEEEEPRAELRKLRKAAWAYRDAFTALSMGQPCSVTMFRRLEAAKEALK